jgi:hypothetical protein
MEEGRSLRGFFGYTKSSFKLTGVDPEAFVLEVPLD